MTPIDVGGGGIGRLGAYRAVGKVEGPGAEVVQFLDGGYVGQYAAGLTVTNYVPSTGGSNGSNGGEASYGIDSYNWCNNGGVAKDGCMVGIQGLVTGDQKFAIGLSGVVKSYTPNTTGIGMTGVAGWYKPTNVNVGTYAGLNGAADDAVEVKPETCALLIDNRSTGRPLIFGRRNNGEHVFEVLDNGVIWTAPPEGANSAKLRFGVTDGKLILEINGQRFGVKLEKV